ncbi:nuclease harbi1-like protein [Plakobranchus ocellatus]|uniref:Nuclease harbi1-like protein n=1 Tax=Plakobranchus ocellatus TaxID=259542 RepID=A0AAV4BKA5_9GAST|nr:nuclease harbi1-like protein [Plakobranchus ocellatus]
MFVLYLVEIVLGCVGQDFVGSETEIQMSLGGVKEDPDYMFHLGPLWGGEQGVGISTFCAELNDNGLVSCVKRKLHVPFFSFFLNSSAHYKRNLPGLVDGASEGIYANARQAVVVQIAADFSTRFVFRHCLGASDAKYNRIKKPNNSGSKFYNNKGFFSIVLLAVTDASRKFVIVDVRSCGGYSDGRTFSCQPLISVFLKTNCSYLMKLSFLEQTLRFCMSLWPMMPSHFRRT